MWKITLFISYFPSAGKYCKGNQACAFSQRIILWKPNFIYCLFSVFNYSVRLFYHLITFGKY